MIAVNPVRPQKTTAYYIPTEPDSVFQMLINNRKFKWGLTG